MEANELRIGNWVNLYGDDCRIQTLGMWVHTETTVDEAPIESVKPIPLTEEWLLKFGFVDDYTVGVWFGPKFKGTDYRFTVWDRYGKEPYKYTRNEPDDVIAILYVHQLQNLYFAITGEELVISKD